MISIIDCGMGNLGSVVNMLKHIGAKSRIISSRDDVLNAEKIILPGVGSWNNGAKKLHDSGLVEALNRRVINEKVPTLGICLGMQLLLDNSAEGSLPGLGWIPGQVKKFNFDKLDLKSEKMRIPHMGWNLVQFESESSLANGFTGETRFYFVHSYHAADVSAENILMTCQYGYEFTCAIKKENIYGVQFHPEKSHKFGMKLMQNFVEL